jgi:hypothetical protein
MCVSNSPASFNKTKGYIGEAKTKEHGLVHVLGYQNKVKNETNKPNAMILHFPAKESMGKNNVIDLGEKGKGLLNHMCYFYEERSKSGMKGIVSNSAKIEMFDTGIYTVIISNKPSLINEALKDVSENKRPEINLQLMQWYEDNYPGYSIAVCCFNTSEQTNADPLFWWYKPMNESELFFPAIDCHTGRVPDLTAKVDVDHVLTCSVSEFAPEATDLNKLNKSYFVNEANQEFFPEKFNGANFETMFGQINGDFVIKKDDVKKGLSNFNRIAPK